MIQVPNDGVILEQEEAAFPGSRKKHSGWRKQVCRRQKAWNAEDRKARVTGDQLQ